jgi:hypothetical protein
MIPRLRRSPLPGPHPRRGFTLVEALIAIALGMVVIAVAFAGLRAAAGAFAVGTRLSNENALLRAGFSSALDELDFWRGADDAGRGYTPLRQVDTRAEWTSDHPYHDGLGLPFTPMSQLWNDLDADRPGRWDPDAKDWSPHRQESRWRGNFAVNLDSDCRFGRYAMFFDRYPSVDVKAYQRDNVNLPEYGVVTPKQTWWCQQYHGLATVLGYYGMIDYLPANTIHADYGAFFDPGASPPAGDWNVYMNADGIPVEWFLGPAGDHPGNFKVGDWADSNRNPFSRYRATLGSAFPFVPATSAMTVAQADTAQRRQTMILKYGADSSGVAGFIANVSLTDDLAPLHPAHWPTTTSTVMRYFCLGKFFNLCLIKLSDPITGQTTQISFNGFGTTLRGARQQRGLDDY